MEKPEKEKPLSAMRTFYTLILCAFTMVCLLMVPVQADIYMYIDSNGVIHFTNAPTTSDYKLYFRE